MTVTFKAAALVGNTWEPLLGTPELTLSNHTAATVLNRLFQTDASDWHCGSMSLDYAEQCVDFFYEYIAGSDVITGELRKILDFAEQFNRKDVRLCWA